jgi:hypothetical protein
LSSNCSAFFVTLGSLGWLPSCAGG